MAITPVFPHALLTVPFNHTTDFTELADNCERFAEVLGVRRSGAKNGALRAAFCLFSAVTAHAAGAGSGNIESLFDRGKFTHAVS